MFKVLIIGFPDKFHDPPLDAKSHEDPIQFYSPTPLGLMGDQSGSQSTQSNQ